MKILLSWLKDYIDINETPEKIAEALTMTGLEVEEIIQPGKNIKGVVVGKILTKEAHPDSDHLTLCTVDVGQGEPLQIVCGAKNHKAGDVVPVAMIGAKLPSGFEISKAKMRGVDSFGMLCSKSELGLAAESSGLYILPQNLKLGEDIVKALKLDEVIFEISITANRGDALSHLGIARELSAIFNLPLKRDVLGDADGEGNVNDMIKVEIENNELCPRYGARIVRNVKIGESPEWMKDRLENVGVRSINNIVDITNYIMLDIGHPMHAFDYDKLAGKKIVVRNAKAGEKIVTLDNIERALEENMLVVSDAEKAGAVAGVMGGLDASVTESTTTVLFEAASFNEVTVRKTSKKLALQSDSSYRFERGTNIDNVPIALNDACRYAKELANGQPVKGICDVYPKPEVLRQIKVRTKRLNKLVGINLTTAQIETFLLRFKFETKKDGEDLIVSVPPYRHDITQEVDVIEEVARLYGYNNIPETLPAVASNLQLPTPLQKLEKRLKDHMVSNGFNELITYSFIPSNLDTCFHEKKPLVLKNALSEEMKVLRTSLKWNMFDAIKRNVMNDEFNMKFFEIGKVFHTAAADSEEHTRLCVGFCGAQNAMDWHDSKKEFDLFTIKGFVQGIADLCKVKVRFAPSINSIFHPTMQMDIQLGKTPIGSFGQIHPNLLDNKKLPKSIFIVEIDLDKLAEAAEATTPRFKAIPEIPAIRRDLALLAPVSVAHRDIQKILVAEGGNLLEDCHLFDVYQGKGIQEGFRSLAYSLSFRDQKKTLTDNEVQPLIDKMVEKLDKSLQIKLR